MPPPPKRENLLVNLCCNVVVPTLILSKLSTPERLGPTWGLVIALAFPLGYGVADYVRRKRANFISILGFVSVMLSGGLGLLKADALWFACKEAAVPLVIGAGVLASMHTSRPLIRELLYNDQVLDVAKIDAALDAKAKRPDFEALLRSASYLLSASFLVSAVLNFSLARWFLRDTPGTPAFNKDLGRMHLWSWLVIAIPSTVVMVWALLRLLKGVAGLTGMEIDDMMHPHPEKKKAKTQDRPAEQES